MKKTISILLVLGLLFIFSCGGDSQTEGVPAGEYKYVGSINSDKDHYPSCRWAKKIYSENEIWFKDKEDARKHGYVPCKVCKP